MAKYGLQGAARVLRALADELEGLPAANLAQFWHSN